MVTTNPNIRPSLLINTGEDGRMSLRHDSSSPISPSPTSPVVSEGGYSETRLSASISRRGSQQFLNAMAALRVSDDILTVRSESPEFRDAQEIITDCFVKREAILNLKNLKLTTEELDQLLRDNADVLSHVQGIDLHGNELSTLPASIRNLSKLCVIDLSNNKFSVFPEEVTRLSGLTYLELGGNTFNAVPDSIVNLKNLQVLDITGGELVAISNNIGALENLEALVLSKNKLTTFSDGLVHSKSLKNLDISGNLIEELPRDFGNLRNLEKVDLSKNKLKHLPESICKLVKLTTLNASQNELEEVPAALGNLSKLEILNLYKNQLGNLPESICKLVKLTTLNASKNKLEEVPAALGNLSKLEILNLYNNQLVNLPDCTDKLLSLKTLDVKGNQIQEIPKWVFANAGLQELDFSENGVGVLPSDIGNLTCLTYLELHGNKIKKIPSRIGELKELDTFSLAQNELAKLPVEIGNLNKLIALNLSENALEELPAEFCNLVKLETLDLFQNKLSKLPDGIKRLMKLQSLDVSQNLLEEVTSEIGLLSSLRFLNLKNNRLTTLPENMSQLSSECIVDAQYNLISSEMAAAFLEKNERIHRSNAALGPQLQFSSDMDIDEVPALDDEVASWYSEQDPELSRIKDFWAAIAQESPEASVAFSKQIGHLRKTAQFKFCRDDVETRVKNALKYLQEHESPRSICLAQAIEGTETCDDKIAFSFVKIEEAILNHQAVMAKHASHEDMMTWGQSMFRSQILQDIADKKTNALQVTRDLRKAKRASEIERAEGLERAGKTDDALKVRRAAGPEVSDIDPTEIVLRYWTALSHAKELDLPSKMNAMLFEKIASDIKEEDIQSAKVEVLKRANSDECFQFVGTWYPYEQFVKKNHSEQWNESNKEIEEEQEFLQHILSQFEPSENSVQPIDFSGNNFQYWANFVRHINTKIKRANTADERQSLSNLLKKIQSQKTSEKPLSEAEYILFSHLARERYAAAKPEKRGELVSALLAAHVLANLRNSHGNINFLGNENR